MIYRKNKSISYELSNIGLGTVAIGGPKWPWGWGPQEDKESINTIMKAIGLGINWIDTAAAYGFGHSEKIVGEAIRKYQKKIFIATKCGQLWDSRGKIFFRIKAYSIRKEVESSLKRLNLEKIDLYQIHWPKPDEDIEEAWFELTKLKKEGKILEIGVSNFNVKQMQRIMEISPIFSNQIPYNMFDRDIESEIIPFCFENNILVLVYTPMASGLLTGKFDKERLENLPSNDWRRSERGGHFLEPEFSINLEAVRQLKNIATKLEISMGQLAIAWILNNTKITTAIVGARNARQIVETVKASSIQISESAYEEIEEILTARLNKINK